LSTVFWKITFKQEPLGQFQPTLVGNMLWRSGFRFVQIKGLAPFGGPIRGKIMTILINLQKSSDEPPAEYIDIWHGTSLGQGDSILFK